MNKLLFYTLGVAAVGIAVYLSSRIPQEKEHSSKDVKDVRQHNEQTQTSHDPIYENLKKANAARQSSNGDIGRAPLTSQTSQYNEAVANAIKDEYKTKSTRSVNTGEKSTQAKKNVATDLRTSGVRNSFKKHLGDYFKRENYSNGDIDNILGLIEDEIKIERALNRSNDPESNKAFDAARADLKAKLTAQYGEQKANEIVLLKESAGYKPGFVNSYASSCAANGIPLEPKTIDNVAILLYVNNVSLPYPTAREIGENEYRLLTLYDSGALNKAGDILNAQQLALLKKMLAERFSVKKQ